MVANPFALVITSDFVLRGMFLSLCRMQYAGFCVRWIFCLVGSVLHIV